jgi:hypothetical protein
MTENDLLKQVDILKGAAARSIDPCLTARFIAISNPQVQALFLKKIQDRYVFRNITCFNRIAELENTHVYFDFDCAVGTVCLVKPAFLVVVNVVSGTVLSVVDPYLVSTLAIDGVASLMLDTQSLGDDTLPVTILGNTDSLLKGFGDGTLPFRVIGYVVRPEGHRVGNG